jgi:hypothetical protein
MSTTIREALADSRWSRGQDYMGKNRNSIGYSCRQNIGVHRVLLSCDGFFF